jgi:TP901-1 family phage major tail protein
MTAKAGKDWLLKIGDGQGSEGFTTLGGLRTSSIKIGAEAIDVTSLDSNQFQELLAGAGTKKVSISGSGVYTDAADLDQLVTDCLAQTLRDFQLLDVVSAKKFAGAFKITSFDRGGAYNKEQTYSISLESSGAVTYA